MKVSVFSLIFMWPLDPSGSGHIPFFRPKRIGSYYCIYLDPSGSGHIPFHHCIYRGLELTQADRVIFTFPPLHLLWTGIGPSGSGHILFHHRIHRGLESTQVDRVMFLSTTEPRHFSWSQTWL